MNKGRRIPGTGVQTHNRQNMEERLKTMEEINNKNIVKMQQSHRIQSKVYEKMLSEQEQFWKDQLMEKEEQMRQMEADIEEWRIREQVLMGEMEALEQRAMEGTTTLTTNFMEAHKQLTDAMYVLEHMKQFVDDTKKKKKGDRRRKRDDRGKSRLSEEESDDAPDNSLHFKPSAYNNRAPSSVDTSWKQQIEQLDGKWVQIKEIMELMREEMEQKSMMGSRELKLNFTDAYTHLTECKDMMDMVKRELEEQVKRRRKERQGGKEWFWKRWYRRLWAAMGMGIDISNQTGDYIRGQVDRWTGLDMGWPQGTPRRISPRLPARRSPYGGRSRSRQPQRDAV